MSEEKEREQQEDRMTLHRGDLHPVRRGTGKTLAELDAEGEEGKEDLLDQAVQKIDSLTKPRRKHGPRR